MIYIRNTISLFLLALISLSASFAQEGFTVSESGLQYRFHRQNEQALKPAMGDMLSLHMLYKINGTTLFYDSRSNPSPSLMELRAPEYPGDINEAMGMLRKGDSATFIIDANDFFKKTVRVEQLPDPFKEGDKLHFELVLNDFMTRDEFIIEQQKALMEKEANKIAAREEEQKGIQAYIDSLALPVKELPGGMYIVHLEDGDGAQAEKGKKVSVHYTGKLLNGEIFDSSLNRGQPIQVTLGANQVIQGWETGIPELKVGGKALLIIPFDMGYGDRPAGTIPPYSTLLFEVELMEVMD
jgi:FKBP-type peptidyl-prolyl cis-trans isomerase